MRKAGREEGWSVSWPISCGVGGGLWAWVWRRQHGNQRRHTKLLEFVAKLAARVTNAQPRGVTSRNNRERERESRT